MEDAIVHCTRTSACGRGPRTTTKVSPTSCSPAAATSRRWRRSRPPRFSANACRAQGSGRERRRPHAPQPEAEHPHGLPDTEFNSLFTTDRPVVFAYHGYPWLIHRLTYRRAGHSNLHVRGYKEEGTTTTPFDMVMLNDLDRFHLVMDVVDRVPGLAASAGHLRQEMIDRRLGPRMRAGARRRRSRDPRLGLAVLIAWARFSSSTPGRRASSSTSSSRTSVSRASSPCKRFVPLRSMRSGIASSTAAQSRRAHADRRRRPRVHRRARGDRAASQRTGAQRHRRCVTRVLGRASGRGLRHGVPADRTRGLNVCGPADLARGLGYPALRVPRALGAVVLGAPELLGRSQADLRLVVCHLGGGCSVTAARDGRSVDTTMGFSPLEGVPMATRSGSIDPGALLFVQRAHGLSVDDVDRTLNEESGLEGLSGGRGLRALEAAARDDEQAQLALGVHLPHRGSRGGDGCRSARSRRARLHRRRRRALGARPSGRMRTPRLSRRRLDPELNER